MAPRQINLFQVAGPAAPPGLIKGEVRLMMDIQGRQVTPEPTGCLPRRIGRLDEMSYLTKGDI